MSSLLSGSVHLVFLYCREQRINKRDLSNKMDEEDEEYDVLQKVLIIGDTSVGKVWR